ncbi:SDR family oxidoreductase [Nocardioides alcanivorans]|uniref:SDR family oxidoreductase n=1 Tax=Nocardioides alcanivorans TaxID=2897352 RepID=UPI0035D9B7C8
MGGARVHQVTRVRARPARHSGQLRPSRWRRHGAGQPDGPHRRRAPAPLPGVPLQRIGEPEEIADVTVFVASDEARYVTGAEIAADGGWSAGAYYPGLPGTPEALMPRR